MSETVFVAGATSAIAQAIARRFAQRQAAFYLVARDAAKLEAVRADLVARGAANVTTQVLDLDDVERHDALVQDAIVALGGIQVALVAYGVLGDAAQYRASSKAAAALIETDFLSPASLLTALVQPMEKARTGTIVALSSVAGDRGRQSNYAYGASKAGLSVFLEGLRHRLWRAGVRVITVKAGFVDTPMTRDFPKGALWTTPERVADDVMRAIARGTSVVYTPWFWRWIMLVVRWLPDAVFLRTSL